MRFVTCVLVLCAAACGSVEEETCTAAQLQCGDTCVDPLSDNANCGRCGNACDQGLVCGNGACASTCPAGQDVCDGACTDTQADEANCGGCGTTCDVDQACRDGACEVRCEAGLMSPITDPWGFAWDGLERTAATLDQASANCVALGARLPTATELYRVGATRTAAVGMSFHTNPLWTSVPADRTTQTTLRLSDGIAGATAAASALTYRCVCPAPAPPAFTGSRCNGDAGSECATVGRYNLDGADRPALRKSAAVWECANERAHVADVSTLVEAIKGGVPGSNVYIASADHWGTDNSIGVRWSSSTWTLDGNIVDALFNTAAPFRCAGPSSFAPPHSATVANEFVGPLGGYKGETVDMAASTWIDANQACFARGGHLARASELGELIQQGLPGGSGTLLWTSDELGYDGTSNFDAALLEWTALDRRFPYSTADTSAGVKSGSHPARCVYYPTDATWTAPTTCHGGCFAVDPPTGPSHAVFDATDRDPLEVSAAFAACAAEGGRLASERDMTEAIRAGLPNGTDTAATRSFVLTSDVGRGYSMVVAWTGVETTYVDQHTTGTSSDMTYNKNQPVALPFRCMWSNELR